MKLQARNKFYTPAQRLHYVNYKLLQQFITHCLGIGGREGGEGGQEELGQPLQLECAFNLMIISTIADEIYIYI